MPKQTAKSRALVAYQPTAVARNAQQPRQKKQQQRSQPRQKQQQQGARNPRVQLTHYLRCLADPFNEPPCRLPDLYPGATVVFVLTQDYTLRSDANGRLACSLSPSLSRAYYSTTLDAAGSVATQTYVPHDDYTATNTAYTWLRLVCGGIRIQYTGPSQTASGWLSVVEDPDINYLAVGASVPGKSEDGYSGPAVQGANATWVPCQEPRMDTSNNAGGNSPTYNVFHVMAEGLPPNTDCFRMRTIRHLEGPPTKTNLARRSATVGHAAVAELEAAAAMSPMLHASSGESPVIQAAVKAAEYVGVKALEFGASKALELASGMFPEALLFGM